MRLINALALVAAIALGSLTGCGGGEKDKAPKDKDKAPVTPPKDKDKAPEPAKDKDKAPEPPKTDK